MTAAGFEEVELVNHNLWYREQARAELEAMKGNNRTALEAAYGTEDLESNIAISEKMVKVAKTGEHCPNRLRGRKP